MSTSLPRRHGSSDLQEHGRGSRGSPPCRVMRRCCSREHAESSPLFVLGAGHSHKAVIVCLVMRFSWSEVCGWKGEVWWMFIITCYSFVLNVRIYESCDGSVYELNIFLTFVSAETFVFRHCIAYCIFWDHFVFVILCLVASRGLVCCIQIN